MNPKMEHSSNVGCWFFTFSLVLWVRLDECSIRREQRLLMKSNEMNNNRHVTNNKTLYPPHLTWRLLLSDVVEHNHDRCILPET